MIIRLLQSFDSITLHPDAQPEGTRPPKEWSSPENVAKGKRKAVENFFPKTHMTMYANVSVSNFDATSRIVGLSHDGNYREGSGSNLVNPAKASFECYQSIWRLDFSSCPESQFCRNAIYFSVSIFSTLWYYRVAAGKYLIS